MYTKSLKNYIRKSTKNSLFHVHKNLQKLGLSIIPNHYYSPIPNLSKLEKTKKIWAKKSSMPGIKTNINHQLEKLSKTCSPYIEEYKNNKSYLQGASGDFGPGYGYIEAMALHGIIRNLKPKNIIEVGSGVSTKCIIDAINLNQKTKKDKTEIICIEPYPSKKITEYKKSSTIKLIKKDVQEVAIETFKKLKNGDLLFIDSSHTVKPGGDVNYIILEILPILNKGVIVHFHDIFFPYDFQRSVLDTFFHWTETSLLRAFLVNNSKAEIYFSLSMLHYERKSKLKEMFPGYNPQTDKNGIVEKTNSSSENEGKHFPSSTYIQIK